jgi:hypothetical protein
MTVPISYPGVYITEIPSGSRTITGVATSITAFVGAASRGPVDVPVAIFSFADFERTFGGLSRSSGLGYAVRDFYQNGGGEALILRLVHMATDKDGIVLPADGTSAAPATLDVDGLKLAAIGPLGLAQPVLQVPALGLGTVVRGQVTGDGRYPGHRAAGIADRGVRQPHLDGASVLAQQRGLEGLDELPLPHALEDGRQLRGQLRRHEQRRALADDLLGGPSVHALRGSIPGGDHAVQGRADNRVGRGLHDRRQPGGQLELTAAQRPPAAPPPPAACPGPPRTRPAWSRGLSPGDH